MVRNVFLKVLCVAFCLQAANAWGQDPNFYIFICFGQSNMEGQATTIAQSYKTNVDPRFRVMEALNCSNLGRTQGAWYTAVPPLCRCNTGLNPVDNFGRTMVANLPTNIKVGVIHVAVSGCKIEMFDKSLYSSYISGQAAWMQNIVTEYGGNPYARIIALAKLAQKDGVIKGILLHQGESNTGDTQWPSKVKKVYTDMITDLGLDASQVPLLAGQVVDAAQGGICAGANTLINSLPNTLPNSYVISSAGCTDTTDNLHFNVAGYWELGRRYAMKMLDLLPKDAPSVSITAPAASAEFSAPASVTITATATPIVNTRTISLVEFFNGTQKIGEDASAPYSFTWTNVAAGAYAITVKATDNTGKQATATVNIGVQGAYGGTPKAIPGTIQFEEFDLGGNNVAYYDNSPGSSVTPVVNYRTTEDVDVENCTDAGTGYNIGYTVGGEWLEYTVNVTTAGKYDLTLRAACNGTGRTVSLQAKGVTIANDVSIPNTGGWQTWQDVKISGISLDAGIQVIRVTIGATDYVNLNYMTFVAVNTSTPPVVSITAPADGSTFTSDKTITISVSATSASGTIAGVKISDGNTVLTTDATAPYSFDWTGMTAGTHVITVEATDNNGLKTSKSVSITVTTPPVVKTVKLKAGWNIIGCPIDGSTDIAKALSSIWNQVETVKNLDSFYSSTNPAALNSLSKIEWGKGYMVKVKAACELDWIVR